MVRSVIGSRDHIFLVTKVIMHFLVVRVYRG
jgi:hypothetical protein